MRIPYGARAYRRNSGNLPELKLINMFVEPSPVESEGVTLLSREGLQELSFDGTGPIAGVFKQDGVFNGDTFVVSGGLGTVSFAASATELGFLMDGIIYRYDGTDFEAVDFPDDARVLKLLYHDGQFFAVREDTGDFYASDVLDLATWDALSFRSAESSPDRLLDAEFLSDAIYLFGSETIEPWDNDTSGDSVPYTRRELSIIDKGIKATGCLQRMDQGLWFISNENMVMVMRGQAPERVSDHALEERIAESTAQSMFGYVKDGHSFVGLRLKGQGTWLIDIATKEICEAQTLGLDNFIAQCATRPGVEPIFGGSDGNLYRFSGWSDGDYPLERRFTAGIPLSGGSLSVDVVSLTANTGAADEYTDDATIEMRVSRDGGRTWGHWRQCPLGGRGEYRNRVRFRRCGSFDEPGALFEFRTVGPWGFRVSGVFINEQGGGRSR